MDKPKITINYDESGVKKTSKLSAFFSFLFVVSIIATFITLMQINDYNENALIWFIISISFALTSLIMSGVFEALSSIAKTALYKRSVLEQTYDFVTSEPNNTTNSITEVKQQEEKSFKEKMKDVFIETSDQQ